MILTVLSTVCFAFLLGPTDRDAGANGGEAVHQPRTGLPAPNLSLEKLLQAPKGAEPNLTHFRGKVVVIEFWATWCAPCVASIPSWNKLHKRFENESVLFLSITDEDEGVVTEFLRKHDLAGWIGIDGNAATFKAYGVRGRPRTAVIDRAGKLVGWTRVDVLLDTPSILERLLRDESVELSPMAEVENPNLFPDIDASGGSKQADSKATNPPLCLILIRPASDLKLPFGGSRKERRIQNVTLRGAIVHLYDVPWGSVIFEFPAPEDKYDILFRWPGADLQRGEAALRSALEATFNITVEKEERVTDVYVLKVEGNRAESWETARASVRIDSETGNWAPTQKMLDRINAGETFFIALGGSSELAYNLSYALDRPIVDQANIEGNYTFSFPWSKKNSTVADVVRIMKEKYGVALTPATQSVEVLVVMRGGV